jgi:hypothetical protein
MFYGLAMMKMMMMSQGTSAEQVTRTFCGLTPSLYEANLA